MRIDSIKFIENLDFLDITLLDICGVQVTRFTKFLLLDKF